MAKVKGNLNVTSQGNQTWTPTMGDVTGDFNLTTAVGEYNVIAGVVFFALQVIWSTQGTAGTGTIEISLPSTVGTTRAAFSLGYVSGIAGTEGLVAYSSAGSTGITIGAMISSGSTNSRQKGEMNTSGQLQISGHYRQQ